MLDKQDAPSHNKRSKSINTVNIRSREGTATPGSKQMMKILASLRPREEMLLRLRFGIGTEVAYPLSQLSRRFSCRRSDSVAFNKTRLPSCVRVRATSCPKFDRILVLPSAHDGALAKAGDPTSIRLTN
jgi:hypothetical protein